MTDTTSIPLNKLVAWKGNVRKTPSSDESLAELAASIHAVGLINPLTVRQCEFRSNRTPLRQPRYARSSLNLKRGKPQRDGE